MRDDPRIYLREPTFLTELQGTPEEALAAIRDMDLDRDRQCILGVYDLSRPEELAGLAEFYDYKPSGKVISVGYRLRPEFWGQGLGTSCARLMLEMLRRDTEVLLVTAHVIPENVGSSRVLLNNGFEHLMTKEEDWGREAPTTADVYTLDL